MKNSKEAVKLLQLQLKVARECSAQGLQQWTWKDWRQAYKYLRLTRYSIRGTRSISHRWIWCEHDGL